MSATPGGRTTTRRERSTIILVTAAFIAVSGVLHLILGGVIPTGGWRAAPAPSGTILLLSRLETAPPTQAPTPRPSPTPQHRVQERATPQAQPSHAPSDATVRRQPIALPASTATAVASGGDLPSSPQGQPALPGPSAPADYSYVIVTARFINEVHPAYPEDAVTHGEEGTVIVLLTIGPQGVSDVRVWESSGYPELDRAALAAAKESTYSTPEMNGEPVTETYRVIYTFSLNS
jgi:periplasmic protein TonB